MSGRLLFSRGSRAVLTNQQQSILRRPLSDTASTPLSFTLWQYKICPFCNKVKSLLAYADVDHNVIEVNPLTKNELKPWSGDYKKVPIAVLNDEQLNGSDKILDALLENEQVISNLEGKWVNTEQTMTMSDFRSNDAEKWMKYATDDLASLLYPNICRSLSDSFLAFSYVNDVDTFSPVQKITIRGAGSLAMYLAASKIKSKRGITDEREALNKVLSVWEEEGLSSGKKEFQSGTQAPNMGDIAVFGTLRSVEGLPAHKEAIEKRGGPVKDWYERMSGQLQNFK
mmetsp:Transcript_21309/g.32819  ORF Transcript_21309/g.32819 Transcript_21309/m.32819 type:complete len:284 (-) Transcript_21309:924-1775(-)|eukprot:CAMPEP_0195294482 /NCGR_PEP_ID=MMETSP0707-20130614/15103_1 /TAXON_ID=33640 /ORGANISM="Asterionellopsis glacialis, Strain CCMP134" /LENGTH=283 /DNA_ID=CAMNT_0040355467 /DNA_START=11 /DNA_END=862 /DNA_ORIENTATION=-